MATPSVRLACERGELTSLQPSQPGKRNMSQLHTKTNTVITLSKPLEEKLPSSPPSPQPPLSPQSPPRPQTPQLSSPPSPRLPQSPPPPQSPQLPPSPKQPLSPQLLTSPRPAQTPQLLLWPQLPHSPKTPSTKVQKFSTGQTSKTQTIQNHLDELQASVEELEHASAVLEGRIKTFLRQHHLITVATEDLHLKLESLVRAHKMVSSH